MKLFSKSGKLFIYQKEIDGFLFEYLSDNTTKEKLTQRKERVIVSLTTYPQRILKLKYTLYSLLVQTLPADQIIVWLAEEEFPLREMDVPKYLLDLKKHGVEIRWTKNYLSYKKLVPSLLEYPDCLIVTVDDDLYYLPDCLEILYKEHERYPNDIITHRARRILIDQNGKFISYKNWPIIQEDSVDYWNFLTGGNGTLYPPHSLCEDVFKPEIFQKLAPYADDVWFWAMAVCNKTRIRVPRMNIRSLIYTEPSFQIGNNCLYAKNKRQNDIQFQDVLAAYPEIIKILEVGRVSENQKQVIIYGAGAWGALARGDYNNILFYVSREFSGKKGRLLDKIVYGPEILKDFKTTPVIIAVKNSTGIEEFLKGLGVSNIEYYSPSKED